jgi:excisionase family DNA binding protein
MTAMIPDPATEGARPDDLPALLTVPHAARLLGLTRSAAYRCAASGELPNQRLGGRVYIITAAIRPLLDGTGKLAA